MHYSMKHGCFNKQRLRQSGEGNLAARPQSLSQRPSSLEETMAGSRSLACMLTICACCWERVACCQVSGGWLAGLTGRRGTGPGLQAVSQQKAH